MYGHALAFCISPAALKAAAEFEQALQVVRATVRDDDELRALVERAQRRYAADLRPGATLAETLKDEWRRG